MLTWFAALNAFEKVFLMCALVGGLLFAVRLVMMFVGGGDTDGADIADGAGGGDVHADVQADGHQAVDADAAFKLLSFQGITAFFMMFGLVGLAMSRGSGLHYLISLGGALAAGLLTVWVTDRLFRSFSKLQSSGTLNLKNAVGQEGKVYLTIKPDEPGKVQVTIQGRLMTLDAVGKDGAHIATDARVKVVELQGTNQLVVTKI